MIIWSKPNKAYLIVIATSITVFTFIIWCILPYDYSHIRRTTHCDTSRRNEERYLLFPMFTIISGSGLGNQLFEIFSLLGMAQKLNRTAIFNKKDWFLRFRLKNVHKKIPKIAEQVETMDIESFKYFSSMESTIREWLKPPKEEITYLETMINREDVSRHKICVHVRRGDFLTDGGHAGTEADFTIEAIDYLYRMTPGVVMIFSNEQQWVKEEVLRRSTHKMDIRIMPTPHDLPFKDLYFSQVYCDTVLITAPSSTFGWWIGYLSRNQSSVYYRDIRGMDDPVKFQMVDDDFFPEKWKKLEIFNGTVAVKL
uniref:L-Fucosyltransferase n=1 Tax=Caenorhabditis tropicalis TaxID=1561998 RepID=A0A1I7UID7_9PELO